MSFDLDPQMPVRPTPATPHLDVPDGADFLDPPDPSAPQESVEVDPWEFIARIEAELREVFASSEGPDYGAMERAQRLVRDALDARWPTADEIAELRGLGVAMWNIVQSVEYPDDLDATIDGWADTIADFLDKLDPPQREPQADDDQEVEA